MYGLNFQKENFVKRPTNDGFYFKLCPVEKCDPTKFLLPPFQPKVIQFKIDNELWYVLPVKNRFVEGLVKFDKFRVRGLYLEIAKILTPEGIKELFPKLHLQNYNFRQKQKNTTDFQRRQYLKKRGLLPDEPDPEIVRRTQPKSVRNALKMNFEESFDAIMIDQIAQIIEG